MKITKEYLKRVIKEELSRVLDEGMETRASEEEFYNYPEFAGYFGKNVIENTLSRLADPKSAGGSFHTSSGETISYEKVGGTNSVSFIFDNGRKKATIDINSLVKHFGLDNEYRAAIKATREV